jgi:D-amino-acid dehydrogenase
MAELKADILVLGAGMVGVGAALHLLKRGRDVILVDRHALAGEETSYGNTGIIKCASVFPYMFPRDLAEIVRYAMNRAPQVRYRLADLPAFSPWLVRYLLASAPDRALRGAMAVLPLIRRSLIEHELLMNEAGVPELLQRKGWIKLFRSESSLAAALREFEQAKQYGVEGELLDRQAIVQREPNLTEEFAGAIHYPAPGFVPDPGGLAKAYAELFKRKGGRFLSADAVTLEQASGGWRVGGAARNGGRGDAAVAREAVVALGPWSDLVFSALGYSIPLAVKRGYHLHLAPRGNAVLHHPVLDADQGFVLAPMNRGIRLTTGVEFADRNAPATPVQIARALPRAHALFPLGDAVDAKPWKGARPCLPDMLAVIGQGAAPCRFMVRLRPPASRPDARPGDRAAIGGDDDRSDAVRRPAPICGRAFWLIIFAD